MNSLKNILVLYARSTSPATNEAIRFRPTIERPPHGDGLMEHLDIAFIHELYLNVKRIRLAP